MPKRRRHRPSSRQQTRISTDSLQTTLNQANDLLAKGQFQEVIQLLEPLVSLNPRDADFYALLGSAYVKAGNLWYGVDHYEKALSLRKDADLLISAGYAYSSLDLKALALQAFQQARQSGIQQSLISQLKKAIRPLEIEILKFSVQWDVQPERAAEGLRLMEQGQIALHNQDYSRSIHLNRNANRLLGDFPPPQNNLSLALFYQGMPEEAIRIARQVVSRQPKNIHALANLVRFLAWSGKPEAARQYWVQLRPLTPHDHNARMKMVEAAAIMEEDEVVYRLLRDKRKGQGRDPGLTSREQLFLAVSEANTGRKQDAIRRLPGLQEAIPWADEILQALKAGKRGLGWMERFRYFHITELIPEREVEAFFELAIRKDKMPAAKFRREIDRYVARYPQFVRFGKITLLEDQQTRPSISLLKLLGTPQAYAVLREFGLGQVGDSQARMEALFALQEAGQIAENETLRFWQDDKWQDVKIKKYDLIERREPEYSPEVLDLIDSALQDFQKNRTLQAEKKYRRILALEPAAKEAYNNLGTIYARQRKHDQAQEFFQKAIELDPLYVMPRCNLAIYLLDENKVEEAQEMIAPLVDVLQLHPQELGILSYVRARIHAARGGYDQALKTLQIALQVNPDDELVKGYLEQLELLERMKASFSGYMERMHKRDLARRERQQAQLVTPDPSLSEALGIYTKDILTGIARQVIPWGGWSALKKAELHQYLVDYLSDHEGFERVVASLTPEERTAFEYVQENGGTLEWDLFDQEFGNDLDDSPYWNYHEPESVMGRLRSHGLLVEVTVEDNVLVSIPVELRA